MTCVRSISSSRQTCTAARLPSRAMLKLGRLMARKLVYYVACTVDGLIAREDGSSDWALFQGEHFTDLMERFPETFPVHLRRKLGVPENARRFDTVLMGRKTYEVGLNAGITSPYEPLRQFVVSRTMPEIADSAVHLHRGVPLELV